MSFPFEPPRQNETQEQAIQRLKKAIAEGNDHLRTELAEVMMQSAQIFAGEEKLGKAVKRIDEALKIVRELVREGQLELNEAIGRCLLFKAALVRFHQGPEAGILAFNDAIDHFTAMCDWSNPFSQNELAVALMNKADLLTNPLGAFGAAIATQEQAAKIWLRLVNNGHLEYRHPLITTLLSCGDAKVSSGDEQSALKDYHAAVEHSQDGLENGETNCQHLIVQALLKSAKLYDQIGDLQSAFKTIRQSIRTVKKLITEGVEQSQVILTSLYLHHGMLYEKVHQPAAALAEYDRCREVYLDMFRRSNWGIAENFMFRTGFANLLMCSGNMLVELRRFREAENAFSESVRQYQRAEQFQTRDNIDDPTIIAYSIGVVHLNYANMLVTLGRFDEAVEMKTQAIAALQSRIEAGHTEVLPNLISAYRKMIAIWSFKGDKENVFVWLNGMIQVLETVVDDGMLEFRADLAASYHQRTMLYDEKKDTAHAEKDIYRAISIYRTLADDDTDSAEVYFSKSQWADALNTAAVVLVHSGKISEAVNLLKKTVEENRAFYEEGNEHICIDLLLAYTQFVDFIESLVRASNFSDIPLKEDKNLTDDIKLRLERLQNLEKEKDSPLPEGVFEHDTPEDFFKWCEDVLAFCRDACELCLKKQNEKKTDLAAKQFLKMKFAHFSKVRGSLTHLQHKDEEACAFYEIASNQYYELIDGIDNLKAKDLYYAAERGEKPGTNITAASGEDPYMDRYMFYTSELRRITLSWAYCHLALGRNEEAEKLYDKENALAWGLMKKGIPNADVFLINSLLARARCVAECTGFDSVSNFYEQALELLRERFRSNSANWDNYRLARQIYTNYALYLHDQKKTDWAKRVMSEYAKLLEDVPINDAPPPPFWLELCQALDIHQQWTDDAKQLKSIRLLQHRLIMRYPQYMLFPPLRDFAESLAE